MKTILLSLMIFISSGIKAQKTNVKCTKYTSLMITRQLDSVFNGILAHNHEPSICDSNYLFYIQGSGGPVAFIQKGKLVVIDSAATIKSLITVLFKQFPVTFKNKP